MAKTVLLTVLDGWGFSNNTYGNSLKEANLKNYNHILKTSPNKLIDAHGFSVGLPEGQMGNSEVGHMNLGAGRIVYQDLSKIDLAIKDKSFFKNEVFLKSVEWAKNHQSSLHLLGLLSDGGVHSTMNHLFALLDLACDNGLSEVYVHSFLDGRDTPPSSAVKYIEQTENYLKKKSLAGIASIIGRYYAMDRDKRWGRTQKAYDCLTLGIGAKYSSALEAISESYKNSVTDEFVNPSVILEQGRIRDHDSIILFNFRPDRVRQLTNALYNPEFQEFNREKVLKNIHVATMTIYDKKFGLPVAYPKDELKNILGEILENHGLKQFRTAETEKYAHVTFFFNGGKEEPFPHEDRVLIASPKVATYDMKPEMSAYEVTDEVIKAIQSDQYSFILVNYANPDMVGHTGIRGAAIKAVETIDECLGKILEAMKGKDITMILTADHGNVECMVDPETHQPHTAHTTNLVPLILVNNSKYKLTQDENALADVAPTILKLLDLNIPEEMTGKCFIEPITVTT